MSVRTVRAVILAVAAVFVLAAGGARGADPVDAQPPYGHSRQEWLRFVQHEIPDLVEGTTFEWAGRTYEVVRVHDVIRASTTRWAPGQRNEASPHRAYLVAWVHVRVDGQVVRARLEADAHYSSFPDGWDLQRVLLYLGRNVSYDFVTGRIG